MCQARNLSPKSRRQRLQKEMAPQVGLEPTTLRLTAGCSTIELLRSVAKREFSLTFISQFLTRGQSAGAVSLTRIWTHVIHSSLVLRETGGRKRPPRSHPGRHQAKWGQERGQTHSSRLDVEARIRVVSGTSNRSPFAAGLDGEKARMRPDSSSYSSEYRLEDFYAYQAPVWPSPVRLRTFASSGPDSGDLSCTSNPALHRELRPASGARFARNGRRSQPQAPRSVHRLVPGHERPQPAVDRHPVLHFRAAVRAGAVHAAQEPAGAPRHARNVGTDLRDLQDLPGDAGQVPGDPVGVHRGGDRALLRRAAEGGILRRHGADHSRLQRGGHPGQLRRGLVRHPGELLRQFARRIRRTEGQTLPVLRHPDQVGHEHRHGADQR